MVTIPVIYIFFVILIILQVITIIMFSVRLKTMEELIMRNNAGSKQEISLRNQENPMVGMVENSKKIDSTTVINQNDNQVKDDILFIKEIKLDRSQVIDMDVQMNRKNP